jgi:hypothetical protein
MVAITGVGHGGAGSGEAAETVAAVKIECSCVEVVDETDVTDSKSSVADSAAVFAANGPAFAAVEDRGARGRVVRCAGFSLVVSRSESLPGTLQQHVRSKYGAHTDVVRVVIPARPPFAITMLHMLADQTT